ncbi:MAG: right-handed parallel beta-helix repeat-containing protein, partial [Candidatus Thorarchaeota archaeon]
NMYGIKLRSLNATLVSNSLTNNGVYISGGPVDFWKHAIGLDNLVNGKPIGYFWNLTTGVIDGSPYGQVILANCTGTVVHNGIFENSTIGIELGYCTDCNIEGNSISGAWSGIYVESSSENIVSNNNVSESTSGILVRRSSNSTIDGNIVSDNHADGVYITDCFNITVTENTVAENTDIGVSMWESTNCTISENILTRNSFGIYFDSTFTKIVDNRMSDNLLYGLLLSICMNNTILDNTFTNNGLNIQGGSEYYQNNIFAGNLINGKPLGLFLNKIGETIDGSQYGQIFIVNCTDVILEDGQLNNASIGILLRDSSFCFIRNSVVSGNSVAGIALYVSPNNTITNNNITGNSGNGVRLGSSDSTVVNNVISDNSGAGVYIAYRSNMTIAHNTIERNEYGIRILASSNNTVHNNSIIGNSIYGLHIEDEFDSNNLFFFNIFAYNEEANAFDDGNNNHWNLTENGNFWSDYNGTGVYLILGDAGSIDYHPFIYVPPETPTQTESPDNMDENGLIFVFIGLGIVGVVSIAIILRKLKGPS